MSQRIKMCFGVILALLFNLGAQADDGDSIWTSGLVCFDEDYHVALRYSSGSGFRTDDSVAVPATIQFNRNSANLRLKRFVGWDLENGKTVYKTKTVSADEHTGRQIDKLFSQANLYDDRSQTHQVELVFDEAVRSTCEIKLTPVRPFNGPHGDGGLGRRQTMRFRMLLEIENRCAKELPIWFWKKYSTVELNCEAFTRHYGS